MEDVITITANSQLLKRKKYFARIKPDWCKYPVIGLPWEVFPFHTCDVARQSRSLVGTHLQLLEFNAWEETQMGYTVNRPAGFLFFVLEGEVRFFNEQGVQISHALGPCYYLVYNSIGHFTIRMDKGQHSILVIALDSDWFIPNIDNAHPAFDPLLKSWSAKVPHSMLLTQKEITSEVWRILARIRTAVVKNMNDGLLVLQYILDCLNIYHRILIEDERTAEESDNAKGEILKEHLSTIFMFDDECRVERIEEQLGWSSWTLRSISEKILRCSIGMHIRKLRMQRAICLLLNTNKRLHEIAIETGFSSAGSFAKSFKKLHGVSPKDFRILKRKPIQNREC